MKRIIAVVLAILMIGALLAACGSDSTTGTVKTSVAAKYDDGFAKAYANKTSTDDSGDVSYEFTQEQYDKFVNEHKNSVVRDIQDSIVSKHPSDFGQYIFIDTEKNAVVIGLNPGEYEEGYASAEAPGYAEMAFRYFQSLETPVSTVLVNYVNANKQSEVYGSFEFSI